MQVRMGIQKDPANGRWFWREYIPKKLIPAYCEHIGKQIARPQIKRRFDTEDRKTAEKLGHIEQVKFNGLIETLKLQAHLSPEALKLAKVSLFAGGLTKVIKKKVDLELINTLQRTVNEQIKDIEHRLKKGERDEMITVKPIRLNPGNLLLVVKLKQHSTFQK